MPRKKAETKSGQSQIVLYHAADGKVTVNVLFAKDNFWLTQRTMAELFGVNTPAVSKHLKNIFKSGELVENSAVSILETTAADGKAYSTQFYNLDAVIAVGLRALNHQVMTMNDWIRQVERFLNFNEQQVLRHAGKISHEMAVAKAHAEFEKYRVKQDADYISDFDEAMVRYLKGREEK